MEHRNKRNFVFCLLAVLMLTGCDGEEPQKEETNLNTLSAKETKEIALTFPETYEEEVDDMLSFHATVVPPVGLYSKNPELHITYVTLDFDKALEKLFCDVRGIKKEEIILQPDNMPYQSAYNQQDEIITNQPGFLRMEKLHWRKVSNSVELSRKDLAYNVQQYTTPQEFSFGTVEEVWKNLEKTLQDIGIKTELKPTFFYMDYETVAKEDEKNRTFSESCSEKEKVWSEEDNGYYITAVQCVDGNTVFANNFFGNGIEGEADTANIQAYIDQDGIQMLEVSRIFGNITQTEESWEMLPFENIVEAVKKRFSLTITGDKADIREFRFSYMTEAVDKEVYRLIPVWFCNYQQTGPDGDTCMRQIIINADTGEEVIYEL